MTATRDMATLNAELTDLLDAQATLPAGFIAAVAAGIPLPGWTALVIADAADGASYCYAPDTHEVAASYAAHADARTLAVLVVTADATCTNYPLTIAA